MTFLTAAVMASLPSESIFILHTADHSGGGNADYIHLIDDTSINETVCGQTNETLDVKMAINFLNNNSIMHHSKKVIRSLVDVNSHKYCYNM